MTAKPSRIGMHPGLQHFEKIKKIKALPSGLEWLWAICHKTLGNRVSKPATHQHDSVDICKNMGPLSSAEMKKLTEDPLKRI